MHRRQAQAGFSFVEILVVMSIIVVLAGMVTMMVPRIREEGRKTDSINNVRQLAMALLLEQSDRAWPRYNGKNFVLSLVPSGAVDARNVDNMRVFYSKGDRTFDFFAMKDSGGKARYKEITFQALKQGGGDFSDLTSYAGRRNAEAEFRITPDKESIVVPIICDDDQGNLHHPAGLVMAYTDGSARFVKWRDLGGMAPPEEIEGEVEPFLGDDASEESLEGMSSE